MHPASSVAIESTSPALAVIVLGAGPVGLALAVELRRRGVTCRVFDKSDGTTKWSKALVVHARTMELFERMGVLEAALARGRRVRGAVIRAEGRELLHIDLADLRVPHNFFLDLNQADTEAILLERLRELGGDVEWNTEAVGLELAAHEIGLRIRGPEGGESVARGAWLCACDGPQSFAREALHLDFPGGRNAAQFLLADVKLGWDRPPDRWYADIHEDALFYAAALKEEGRWRLITELPRNGSVKPPESLLNGESPRLEDLEVLLQHSGYNNINAHDPHWMSWFKVNHRILDSFRHGRVFFAGDAAHLHPPVGGQGMNIGLHDAFNLGWKLASVVKGEGPESLLDSYSPERRPAAAGVVEFTDLALRTGLADSAWARNLRDVLVGLLDGTPPAKRKLERVLSEVDVNYQGSPVVEEPEEDAAARAEPYLRRLRRWRGRVAGPRAGDRAPDARLRRPDESVVRLFELTRGEGWHLLVFPGQDGGGDVAELLRQVRSRFGDRFTAIEVSPEPDLSDLRHLRLRDDEGSARRTYGVPDDGVILIRPDGHIGFRGQPVRSEPLLRHLEKVLIPADTDSGPRVVSDETVDAAEPKKAKLALIVGALAGAAVLARLRLPAAMAGPRAKPALAIAALFAASGLAKLAGASTPRRNFFRWGLPPGLLTLVGVWEVLGAAGLLSRRTRGLAGGGLATLMAGAAATHLRHGERKQAGAALALLLVTTVLSLSSRKGER